MQSDLKYNIGYHEKAYETGKNYGRGRTSSARRRRRNRQRYVGQKDQAHDVKSCQDEIIKEEEVGEEADFEERATTRSVTRSQR